MSSQRPLASGPAPASRFGGGTASRFGSGRFGGREEVQWTVVPLRLEAVRISLEGLGDPLHRLLGTPINAVFSKPAKLNTVSPEQFFRLCIWDDFKIIQKGTTA